MKLTVCGVEITFTDTIVVEVETDPAGETMPPVSITVKGGTLEVDRSAVSTTGPIAVHPFS